ncbi:MAG: hypothetical protein A2Y98_01940 [Candidatus Portnoybacteria bacterium RBG_19FT_COMBO_36_7]|uniref:DUF11 domain-containing protein n=1 Tax=Candidatus Portnoybacteria bacterium RBG_19FT_COMBO_36_7 TaxID=1801992 RepID=A0A1G2F6H4_9BACT|nr:MAG: hypothetical protein A2Y98_01940 [Candidatus Portnoybacteria bacterium RBG_19FT_COMBO_36_7]
MGLDELQKQLYGQKEEEVKREGAPEQFQPGHGADSQTPGSLQWGKEVMAGKPPLFNEGAKKLLKFLVIAFVIGGVIIAGFLFWRSQSFDKAGILVTVFGIERVISGEEVNYVVRYQNNTNVTLTDIKLTFFYPKDSIPVSKEDLTQIGDLQASVVSLPNLEEGKEGKIEFSANITGLKDDKKTATARLSYHAGSTFSAFESAGEFTSVIFSVPLVLDFSMPDKVVNGQQVTITLKYLNTANVGFENLILSVEYPPGFNFNSALPSPSEGSNIWELAEIGPREEGKIIIVGVLTGAQEEVKTFKANIAKQQGDIRKVVSEGLSSTLISLSPLSITMTLDNSRENSVNVGDKLIYRFVYQNTVSVPIGPIIVTVKLDTKALDFAFVKPNKGFFNSADNTVIWNESTLAGLKMVQPGQKGELFFNAEVKQNLPIYNFNDRNFIISVSAKIDSAIVPVQLQGTQISGFDTLSTKVNSKLYLSSKGYYTDTAQPNTGPIPPAVGQQTTYTIYWDVVNLANDVDDIVVEGYLPPYISWLGRYSPSDADIKYDQNSGKLTWKIGKLSASVGILSPVKRLIFKISLLPSIIQVGEMVNLLIDCTITGRDTFTGATLSGSAKAIRSDLPDDPAIGGYNAGKVVQ